MSTYCFANKGTRAKRAKIITIVAAYPKITGVEIINQYETQNPQQAFKSNRARTRAMLQNLCCDGDLKWLEGDRYIIGEKINAST